MILQLHMNGLKLLVIRNYRHMWQKLTKTTKNELPTHLQPIGLINAVWIRRWLYLESEVYHLLYVMFSFKGGSLPQQLWGHCLCYCTKSLAYAPIKNTCLRLICQQKTKLLYNQPRHTSCIFNSFSSYPGGKTFFPAQFTNDKIAHNLLKGSLCCRRQWSQRFQHHL